MSNFEFKGTQGKWTFFKSIKSGYILNIPSMGIWFSKDDEKCKADLLLITKAPEMFEMLKNIFDDYDYAHYNWEKIEKLLKEATEL